MKRILLLSGVLAIGMMAQAQVQRKCMGEAFSNASCPPCASQNPAYNTLLGSNTSKVVAIKYQTNWPGVDPMNAQTQSEVASRVTYYSVSGVPYGRLDGTAYAGASYSGALANLDQAEIDARYAVTSPFSMTITPTLSPGFDSVRVTVNLTTPGAFSGTTMKLHVSLIEKQIDFSSAPGTNGETEFHNVFRKSFSGMGGYSINNSWSAATSTNFNFAVKIPSFIYKHSELAVIAFVQDDATKEVHQAEIADVPVTSFGVTQNIASAPLNCTSSVSGVTVDFKNTGSVTITSATINYNVDGGSTMTVPYAGTLAVGSSTAVNIPTLTGLTAGSHTLNTWVTDINGSGASGQMGLATKTFNVFSGAGTATPLTQNFASSSFPYVGWAYDNPNPSISWARVTTNTGSMKFDNYTYANGSISNFIVEPVDMTGLTNATLSFDVAYCQYTTENDRLEVFVSTDCGSNWTSVYNKAGSTLATKAAQTSAFTPTAAQWRSESVDLSSYASATQLFIRYKATSAYGNNLYVDNINIASSTSSINENEAFGFNVYPNPTSDVINVSFDNAENVTFTLINAMGQTVKIFNNVNTNAVLSLEGLANGVYILNADINGNRITKQIIKN